MKLTHNQLAEFNKLGYLSLEGLVEKDELNQILSSINEISTQNYPGHVLETHGKSYRAFHGCHLYSPVFNSFIRLSKFLEPARQILKDAVYLHQLKVNLKATYSGEMWPWHQDYIYWKKEDQIKNDQILSVMIFLDDIDEFNGPLYFIPGSHLQGFIDVNKSELSPDGWEGNVSASLSYQVDKSLISSLVKKYGLYSAKGKKGTVVWFHGNLIHASPSNISPFTRRILILTYNAVSNAPKDDGIERRPEFLNGRDRKALNELEEA